MSLPPTTPPDATIGYTPALTPLALSRRGPYIENHHAGWWAVVQAAPDATCQLRQASPGADQAWIFARSSAKPFQALPILTSPWATQLSPQAQALLAASHSGTPSHQQVVAQVLQMAHLSPSDLACGAHRPFDPPTAQQLRQQNCAPTPLHHNCSGQHAVMAWFCQKQGWPTTTYHHPDHPLQQAICQTLAQWIQASGFPMPATPTPSQDFPQTSHGIPYATDGCSLPAHYLPLTLWASLYAQLAVQPQAKPLVTAMTTHPDFVAGPGRFDTLIMQATANTPAPLLCKSGADGVIGITHLSQQQGLVLKMADGNTTIRDAVVLHWLIRQGWLTPDAQATLQTMAQTHPTLAAALNPAHTNTAGHPVGHLQIL